jgi:hypothetical protein
VKTCIDCKDRHLGCHDKCKDYKEYRKKIDKSKEGREGHFEYSGYMAECLWRNRR